MLAGFLTLLGFSFLIWRLVITVKKNPEAFSKENINKSFTTLGILALGLIGVIVLVIFILKQ